MKASDEYVELLTIKDTLRTLVEQIIFETEKKHICQKLFKLVYVL